MRYSYHQKQREESIAKLKNAASNSGLTILTTDSEINPRFSVTVTCANNHVHSKSVKSILKGSKCGYCEGRAGIPITSEIMKERLTKKGLTILSLGKWEGSLTKVEFKCVKGHVNKGRYKTIKGCSTCDSYNRRNDFETLLSAALKEGWTYSGPKRDKIKFEEKETFVCPSGHDVKISFRSWFSDKNRCPKCALSRNTSDGEKDLERWVTSLGFETEPGYRILDKYMVDIWIPEHNLGIEYNGLYHHAERQRNYHKIKHDIARSKNIILMQIWEDEWLTKPEIVKSVILSKLPNNNFKTIPARKCKLVKLKIETARLFYEDNHLLGAPISLRYTIGLMFEETIVMALTLAKHHRNNSETIISRVCTKVNTSVIGGFAKLLSKCPKPLVTWSDNRYSEGALYEKNGFLKVGDLSPDYQYVKGVSRFSKQSLKKAGEEKSSKMTEMELRYEQGYRVLWDAGKIKWLKNS